MKIIQTDQGFDTLKKLFQKDYQNSLRFAKEAREDYAFYEGEQWTEDEKQQLDTEDKPRLVLNLAMRNINAILGAEISNKRRIVYNPRTTDRNIKGDVATAAAEWFQDEADSDSVNSDAFADAMITGLGVVDVSLDFDRVDIGAPFMETISSTEIIIDRNAKKPNAIDAKRAFRIHRLTREAAQAMFPEADNADLNFSGEDISVSIDEFTANETEQIRGSLPNEEDYFGKVYELESDYVFIVEARWIEDGEDYYLTKNWKVIEKADYDALPVKPSAAKMRRRVTRRAWMGARFLKDFDKPLCEDGSLGWLFITCYYSKTDNRYFGLIRNIRDPQRMVNRYYSQSIYTMDKASKGGLLAEDGAFENINEAERLWSSSSNIIRLKANGINRIHPKPVGVIPDGLKELFQVSMDGIGQVLGISQEFLGTREANQPNVLENTRKQSTLNVLAILYNNLSRYRKELGKAILYILQKYVPDGTLMRISAIEGMKYVKFLQKDVLQEYDLVIDEAPNTVNEKEKVLAYLQQSVALAVQWQQAGLPLDTIFTALEYTPLPQTLLDKIREQIEAQTKQQQQQPPQIPPDIQLKQAELQQKGREAQVKAQLEEKKIEKDLQVAQMDAATQQRIEKMKHDAFYGEDI